MIRIFIEAKKKETSEYNFLDTYIHKHLGIDCSLYSIECVDGKDNLPNAQNKFLENTVEGGVNLLVFDADTPGTGGGFETRKNELQLQLDALGIEAEMFLFPNNGDDGIFENLLEKLALTEKYKTFFGCFSDYEMCLGNDYRHPDLKAKVFTYISSMKSLSNSKWKRLGTGNWQFSDANYWDLENEYLEPLKTFLLKHLSTNK